MVTLRLVHNCPGLFPPPAMRALSARGRTTDAHRPVEALRRVRQEVEAKPERQQQTHVPLAPVRQPSNGS